MDATLTHAPKVYRLLAASNNVAADRAILEVLPQLEPACWPAAIGVLVQRRRVASLVELISRFSKYPPELRAAILTHAGSLEGALRTAIGHQDTAARLSALVLIAESGDCKLAYLLTAALAQSCPATREQAAKTILAFAERHLQCRSGAADAETIARFQSDRGHLTSVLERALGCWELHFRTEVLLAAAWLAEPLERTIAEKAAEPRSRLAHAFNALLSTQPDPRAAPYVLRALTMPALRAAASRIIGHCQDDAFMAALISESWLLKDGEVRKACASVRSLNWLSQSSAPLLSLPRGSAAPALRFLAATGLPSDTKVKRFSEMVAGEDVVFQRAALWQLSALQTDAAAEVLRLLARRSDPALATLARHELERRRRASNGAAGGMVRRPSRRPSHVSRSDPVAPGAEPGEPERDLEAAFDALAGANEEQRVTMREHPIFRTPAAGRYLRAGLASSDPQERIRALRIVGQAGLADQVTEQVYRLAHDPDPGVRSSAMSVLGAMPSPTSARILRGALHDLDARVQANAVESLDALEVERYEEWVESKLEAPSGRVRANAVKTLLTHEVRRAAEVLIEMLESEQPGERLSALWVVERLKLRPLVERVDHMAQDDADEAVRRRAAEVIHAVSGDSIAAAGSEELPS